MLAPPAAYPATVVAPLSRGLWKSSGLTSLEPSSSTLWYTFGRDPRFLVWGFFETRVSTGHS